MLSLVRMLATFLQLSVMSLLDNQKIYDGIRHWVKMIDVKSGKKVVVCTRIPILYSLVELVVAQPPPIPYILGGGGQLPNPKNAILR